MTPAYHNRQMNMAILSGCIVRGIARAITPELSSTPETPPTTGHLGAFCTLHVNEKTALAGGGTRVNLQERDRSALVSV